MPNDEIEQTRLSIMHQIFLLLLHGELTKVPVPAGACRILDVGTGPGDWALEMAEQYPDAEIVATDISVFDSGPARMGMPNVCFQLDNAEDEWTYRDPFDLGLEARSIRPLTATGNWTAGEVRDLCEKVKTELIAASGLTLTVRFLTGRKSPANRRPRHRRFSELTRQQEEREREREQGPRGGSNGAVITGRQRTGKT
ncbi:hypothetical protein Egran_02047 [Elaphomyces granulatus]|uniref:Methyltransferase domain-containing protein n=1 Tax=Elaphomyces granulatus TaxID=519963 RepID=A0A232M1H0_9EURO|nr:hypothetical protein Egran_02047 [Elaphomyces granulatus]